MLGNLMLSRDLVDPESKVGSEFFTAMTGLMEWGGHPNIADLFPCLRWLDLQGLKKKMDRDVGKALDIALGFVRERLKERQDGRERRKDFLDVLLEFQGSGNDDEPAKLSEKNITRFILEMFLAGSETTSSTVEWALTQLLCNPKIMNKVKDELARVVGPKRRFEESDIDNLPYFQAVVKETLRFYPPLPFLVPRKAIRDTNFLGYNTPKDTQVLVNAWAIGRDPEYWDDPLVFRPERFLGSKTEYKGQHFEFIPFGAGRRMCAGVPLAHRMLHLVLGSLLHEFDWELESHVTAETMDMTDRLGIAVRKSEPLKAIPKKSLKARDAMLTSKKLRTLRSKSMVISFQIKSGFKITEPTYGSLWVECDCDNILEPLMVSAFCKHGDPADRHGKELERSGVVCNLFLISLCPPHQLETEVRLQPAATGPRGWPVFGHMFNLGTMPHRTLAGLKQLYGPVVWLKLGSRGTMVILTTKAAAELFKNHDLSFGDRNIVDTMRPHDYNKSSFALAPYGTYWRMLRRICTVEMFVSKRINETVSIRRKGIDDMLLWIEKEASATKEGRGIHVARFTFLASFNMLGNLMLSRDLVDPESKVGSEFFTAMNGLMQWGGHPNITDLFPCLGWLDLQGLRKKADRDMGKALEIAFGFVRERVKERQDGGDRRKDFLDVLLEFEGSGKDEPAKLSEKDTGSETTSSTAEWALTQLLCNPKIMIEVKDELAKVIGPKRRFEESDIDNLPYFQAIVKETLRFHPPVPFLVPRKAIQDTNFMGYNIPKDTQVFVNAWAIGRDPEYWDDPLVFKPERFLGSKTEYKGQHFEFIPFGADRRMCAGVPLAHRMLHIVLGSLLHEFDWTLESHVTAETMDMTDRLGVTVRKSEPLKAIPKKSLVL
ncbi:hypothetical protein RJ639_044676 [Escallonia herrerae]|uniref:Cytochrome P450 n=1 Tax=Escallonia herrerae TaxID=1293975 RepID=A0AA88WEQ3_9ASTE|nr:hypothetical protein RJ639_044676 [Escallonia herrerae]